MLSADIAALVGSHSVSHSLVSLLWNDKAGKVRPSLINGCPSSSLENP